MKRKLLVNICLCCLLAIPMVAQEAFALKKEIKMEGKSKTELYHLIRKWVASGKEGIPKTVESGNLNAGTIVLNDFFEFKKSGFLYKLYEGYVNYSIHFKLADGLIEITYTDFVHDNKEEYNKNFALGKITEAEEYTTKGIKKKADNKVWKSIKDEALKYTQKLTKEIEKLK